MGFGTSASVQGTVRWYDQPNQEEVDEIKNGDTPNNLLGSSWNFLAGVGSLGSS